MLAVRSAPGATRRWEDVAIDTDDRPGQPQRDESVEEIGAKRVGDGHQPHAGPSAEHDGGDQVREAGGEAEDGGAERILADAHEADGPRGDGDH